LFSQKKQIFAFKKNDMVRKAVKNDFDFIYSLYMHPQVNPFLLYELMEAENFTAIYKKLLEQQVKYIYSSNEQNAGMFKLIPFTYRSSHIVYLGGLAIHPSFAGKGEGEKMLKEVIELTADLGFLRIELSVAAGNTKAIKLYEKVGFKKEGLMQKYTYLKSEEAFIDEVLMAFIH
jgi:RimJ/RimL family protein N-acetyltransferase